MGQANTRGVIEDCIFCRANGNAYLVVYPIGHDEYQMGCPCCGMRGPRCDTFNDAINVYNAIAKIIIATWE